MNSPRDDRALRRNQTRDEPNVDETPTDLESPLGTPLFVSQEVSQAVEATPPTPAKKGTATPPTPAKKGTQRQRWHFNRHKESWVDILNVIDQVDPKSAPWNVKNKNVAYAMIAQKLQELPCTEGYKINGSNVQTWFEALFKQDVQTFLGIYAKSGEGEGGPAATSDPQMEELFVRLKEKCEAGPQALKQQVAKDQKRNELIREGIKNNGRLGTPSPSFVLDEGEFVPAKKPRKNPEDMMTQLLKTMESMQKSRAETQAKQFEMITETLKLLASQNQALMQMNMNNHGPSSQTF